MVKLKYTTSIMIWLMLQILELVRENATLRGQLAVIKDQLAMAEADRDSQTETVKRLLSGVETDKNITTKQLIELESARMVRFNFTFK